MGDRAIELMANYTVTVFIYNGYQAPRYLENGQIGRLQYKRKYPTGYTFTDLNIIYPRTCTYPSDLGYVAYS